MGDSEYADIEKIVQRQKKFFSKGVTKDISFRKKALKHLKRAVRCYEEELEQALKMDLGKHRAEAYMTEIGFVLAGISQAMHNVEKWAHAGLYAAGKEPDTEGTLWVSSYNRSV